MEIFSQKIFLGILGGIFWGSKSRNGGEFTKLRPETESWNSRDHKLRGSPVYISSQLDRDYTSESDVNFGFWLCTITFFLFYRTLWPIMPIIEVGPGYLNPMHIFKSWSWWNLQIMAGDRANIVRSCWQFFNINKTKLEIHTLRSIMGWPIQPAEVLKDLHWGRWHFRIEVFRNWSKFANW